MQRVLSRGVYEEQYERSLRDCMTGAEGFEEMLGAHESQVRYNGFDVSHDVQCQASPSHTRRRLTLSWLR